MSKCLELERKAKDALNNAYPPQIAAAYFAGQTVIYSAGEGDWVTFRRWLPAARELTAKLDKSDQTNEGMQILVEASVLNYKRCFGKDP